MINLKAVFSEESGEKIRPLHGVNSGPMNKVFTYDSRPLFKEIGIPYARLHDVEYPYGSGEFIDIPCIFKNFDADENDPDSYNFALTDEYIAKIFEVGCAPFFRLGVSIEHAPVKRYVFPPKDYGKWARICEHIIMHYTDGWAEGFDYRIEYWEIWNEPDGGRNMWCGTPEEYFELYVQASRYLKSRFPHLKIGGPGLTGNHMKFAREMMQYICAANEKGERVPLDFLSWHKYFADINIMLTRSREFREMLNEFGYSETESIFNEWNYMISWSKEDQAESYRRMKNHIGAAHHAAVLCAMQQSTDISSAMYFEGDVVKEFCGIFDVTAMSIGEGRFATVGPTKAFYAFKYFGELYRMGNAVCVEGCGENVYACAASGASGQGIMFVNYNDEPKKVRIELENLKCDSLTLSLTDEASTNKNAFTYGVFDGKFDLNFEMTPNSVCYLGGHHAH